jgi:long-chain acyl-CoA synthetase
LKKIRTKVKLDSIFSGQIVGIYATSSPSACQYILNSSKTRIVVIDDDHQLGKIKKIRENLPHLKTIIRTMPSGSENLGEILSWQELEKFDTDDVNEEYDRRLGRLSPADTAMYCFTSGTTGLQRFFNIILVTFLN